MINEGYIVAEKYINQKIGKHLTNIIMEYYWGHKYYMNVSRQLREYNVKTGKMQLFLTRSILPIITNIHTIQNEHYLLYLKYYNSFLMEVANNNGLRLYLTKSYPHMQYITHFITQHRFVGVKLCYRYICNYCLSISNVMRYQVITNFKKLNNIDGDLSDIFSSTRETIYNINNKYA